ncbi:hypothetical protein NPIL_463541 [Nephila pilipes]|uniref:Uncharacterized protein n=1 Tax=Nephila pilipes TaxID=299642 RepID=A0A8X6UPV0_NEPPI|nr:hypothetical protein NPIL_463541 [Nephila pilipes]
MSLDEMNTECTEYKPESSASQSAETKARVTCTRHSSTRQGGWKCSSLRTPPPLFSLSLSLSLARTEPKCCVEFMKCLPFLAASGLSLNSHSSGRQP